MEGAPISNGGAGTTGDGPGIKLLLMGRTFQVARSQIYGQICHSVLCRQVCTASMWVNWFQSDLLHIRGGIIAGSLSSIKFCFLAKNISNVFSAFVSFIKFNQNHDLFQQIPSLHDCYVLWCRLASPQTRIVTYNNHCCVTNNVMRVQYMQSNVIMRTNIRNNEHRKATQGKFMQQTRRVFHSRIENNLLYTRIGLGRPLTPSNKTCSTIGRSIKKLSTHKGHEPAQASTDNECHEVHFRSEQRWSGIEPAPPGCASVRLQSTVLWRNFRWEPTLGRMASRAWRHEQCNDIINVSVWHDSLWRTRPQQWYRRPTINQRTRFGNNLERYLGRFGYSGAGSATASDTERSKWEETKKQRTRRLGDEDNGNNAPGGG